MYPTYKELRAFRRGWIARLMKYNFCLSDLIYEVRAAEEQKFGDEIRIY
jgi:hypothetical protein